MKYSAFLPDPLLQSLAECYWIVEGTDQAQQKIIPDGFTELIFHFEDPYKVFENRDFQVQPVSIAAGQIQKPIFLKPTGKSGVLGIKFKPAGMWKLFGCDMNLLTDQTLSLNDVIGNESDVIIEQLTYTRNNNERIHVIEAFLLNRLNDVHSCVETDLLINEILESAGQISIHKLLSKYRISARKMERLFLQQVGVPAKLYTRLVRFTHVFKMLQQPDLSRSDVTWLCGYFDQAHFNKEFREFTGENPEAYFQQNHSFSNFFLNR